VVREPKIRAAVLTFLDLFKTIVPVFLDDTIDVLGALVFDSLSLEYQGELLGIARDLKADINVIALAQVAYELTDSCTSIVALDSNNEIVHVRNLDFADGEYFTAILRNLTAVIEVQRAGKTLYHANAFGGFVGVLTGVQPHNFAVSVNTRFQPGSPFSAYFSMLKRVLQNGTAVFDAAHAVRRTLETPRSFADAVTELSTIPLVGDIYFTVSGVAPTEGVILARNDTMVTHRTPIGTLPQASWYVLQTNYDFWNTNASRYVPFPSPENPNIPWYDNRQQVGYDQMAALGKAGRVSLSTLLTDVLSVHPVLNRLTVLSALMSPRYGTFFMQGRYCNDPCTF